MFDELKCITIERPYKGFQNNGVIREWTTLDKLYKDGWWITEIFGSHAVIVKKSKFIQSDCPKFIVLYKPINLTKATKKSIYLIEKTKQKYWKTYEKYMLPRD